MEASEPALPQLSYETVEPLLARSRVNGTEMEYVFRCPVTGFEVTGSAPVPQYEHAPIAGRAEQTVRSLANPQLGFEARDAADRSIPFSGTIAGIAGGLRRRRQATKQAQESLQTSPADQQEASRRLLLTAFGTVADRFAWDAAGKRWVKAQDGASGA